MDQERKTVLLAYVRNQLTLSAVRLEALTHDDDGKKYPQRDVYKGLKTYIDEFGSGKSEPRWIALAGLRGVGKTTLLAQLYASLQVESTHKLYIALDQAFDLGYSLTEILSVYEELLGASFETLQTPLYLFLDEVQYQDKWAVTVKTLIDRSKKIFVLATGSSALSLATNADTARRMVFEKIYPLSFSEYIHAKLGKEPVENLSQRLANALFFSENVQSVYTALHGETTKINEYWIGIERFEIDRYLKFGTLPVSLSFTNETLIYQRIDQIIDAVIQKDVTKLNAFEKQTISKLNQLLYALSGADMVSIVKLAETVDLNQKTVTQALETLVKTEILLRILPNGAHYSQVKKPSKYLFTSSAYRAMYYNLVGSVESYENYKGKLLEDVMGMYLIRLFRSNVGVSLTYDSAEAGADFIFETKPKGGKIILETGTGKKGNRGHDQVKSTMSKVGGKYGLVVSQTHLALNEETNCISVPLEYFLLL